MARVTMVKAAMKDYPDAGIKKGESYYWWKFRRGPKMFSKTPPKPSQLTQSEFLGELYAIQEEIEQFNPTTKDDFESGRDDLASRIRNLGDQQEEKLSNMPDSLQQGPTGELLQGRKDSCDAMADEIEAVEIEDVERGDMSEEENAEAHEEALQNAICELQGVEYQGE